MAKIIVLGAGMVGRTIAADLSVKHQVTSADISQKNLALLPKEFEVAKAVKDLSDAKVLTELIADFDLVVGAVPGFMGYKTVETCIMAGKNIIDISFFPEDAFGLDALAKEHDVTAIVDCGVAPGVSNLAVGYHSKRMKINAFRCYVGGLPFKRDFPFQYKAPFSPIDVIEEYKRPARYVENGNVITKPALSDAEFLEFDEVGTLVAFNSDGLRSILKTINAPNMIEKTLRYPGHIEYIKVLMESGFFNEELIDINGNRVRPVDFTTKILFDKWFLDLEDDEFTIMKIIIEGEQDGESKKYIYDLFDRRDKQTGFSSMSRTTGFTACAAAELVLNGLYKRKGISPPEFIGEDEICYKSILNYLMDRNVIYRINEITGDSLK